jgi:hypothetical protein
LGYNLLKTKLRQLGCAGLCVTHCCLNLRDTGLLPIHTSIIIRDGSIRVAVLLCDEACTIEAMLLEAREIP